MKRYLQEPRKSKKPTDPPSTITDAFDSSSEPATSTSTIMTADPMPSALASATTASLQSVLAPGVTTAHELLVSPPVSAPAIGRRLHTNSPCVTTAHELLVSPPVSALAIAPVVRMDTNSSSLPDSDTIMQGKVIPKESEQSFSQTRLGSISNAQNVLITGGTFVNCEI